MHSQLHILSTLTRDSDFSLLHLLTTEQLPGCVVTKVIQENLQNLLNEGSYDYLFFEIKPDTEQESSELINKISINYPNLYLIPIVSPESDQQIQYPRSHNILFYLSQPITDTELNFTLKQIALRMPPQNPVSQTTKKGSPKIPGFIGECHIMQQLFTLISRIADDEFSTVLIRGESGTGKELVARAIHSSSGRKSKNFVPVNCAAIPDDLLESELFGHMKGSFTGANQSKQGRIQYADGGTLFLDEIGDMKPALQAKLLRVLQEKEFEPVGSLKAIPVDTRVLAATHCDLEKLVREGQFREDLYYRLSVIPLEVPPLRDRQNDIPLLLNEFISTYTTNRGREKIFFTPHSLAVLTNYEWRGNVRELENLVQHMSILYAGKQIHPHHLPEKYTRNADFEKINNQLMQDNKPQSSILDSSRERAELLAPLPLSPFPTIDFDDGPVNFNELINEFEKELILKAMNITSGNKKEAARMLCLKRTTLLEKIKKKELTAHWEQK